MNCIVRKKCYKVWTFHSLNFIHKFWILKKCIIRILGAWNKGNNSTFLHVALAILIPVKWLRQTTTADLMRAHTRRNAVYGIPFLWVGEQLGPGPIWPWLRLTNPREQILPALGSPDWQPADGALAIFSPLPCLYVSKENITLVFS